MDYIGIDVSSQKLNIHISGEGGGDYEIENSSDAIHAFVEKHNVTFHKYVVGAESTGKYHLICQEFFVLHGFEFRVLNPILTKKVISATVRKKKTDKSDAQIIAFLLLQGEGQVVTKKQLDTTKKTLLRARTTIVTHTSSIKLLIHQLKKTTSNEQMQNAILSLEALVEEMKSVAKDFENNAIQGPHSMEEQLIRTIPGFAAKLSAIVASEVGDFTRFPSSTQFKAYVGIDPKVTQSGNSCTTGRITKRGNPHLRSAFYLAAQVARQFDPELKQFYEKKMSEGKHYHVAICAVARKLCERVFAVVTRKQKYQINSSISL